MYGGGGGGACTKFPTANSGKNDIEKTIIQKRNENENENTISLTKTITKTKIESKTKLTLCKGLNVLIIFFIHNFKGHIA